MALSDKEKQTPAWREQLAQTWQTLLYKIRPARPAPQPGMGAIPHTDGTVFRVWAPNAEAVYVTGSFNNWHPSQIPLAHESNGYWSVNVPQAQVGDEYKFVLKRGRQQLLRTDPYAKDVRTPFQNGVVRNGRVLGIETAVSPKTTPFQPPSLEELVIYELHVGTFGEGQGSAPFNFEAVIAKLPYLRVLGINAIELMPVKAFPGELSWGYNPAHPFAISQVYGGPEKFKQLIDAAHAQGIAVLVDVVYNHFGPQELSLWQFDGWQQHGLGGIYFYNDWRSNTPWADTVGER
jgi:1,4-alpha-glucan branching enzyme